MIFIHITIKALTGRVVKASCWRPLPKTVLDKHGLFCIARLHSCAHGSWMVNLLTLYACWLFYLLFQRYVQCITEKRYTLSSNNIIHCRNIKCFWHEQFKQRCSLNHIVSRQILILRLHLNFSRDNVGTLLHTCISRH